MDNTINGSPFCGKRRQAFDDGDSEIMISSAENSIFSGSNVNPTNFGPNHANQGTIPAPKRVCGGVSSFHTSQTISSSSSSSSQNLPNQTMQPHQEAIYPSMGGDSKLFLDSPPHEPHGAMETDSMETEEANGAHHEPLLGVGKGRYYNGALYNMRDIGQELQGVDMQGQKCKGSPKRVCIRCLAGEPGHITHILECIS